MKYFIGILITVALLLAGGWYYWQQRNPATTPIAAGTGPQQAEAGSTPSSATAADAKAGTALDKEAQAYVRELSELHTKPIPANDADNFVSGRQGLKLLGPAVTEETTPRQLIANAEKTNKNEDAPLTIVQEVERVEMTTPQKLLQHAGTNLNQPVRVLENGKEHDTTVGKLAEQYPDHPDTPITIIRNVQETRTTTLRELRADKSLNPDKPIKVVRGHQGLTQATVNDLVMNDKSDDKDSIYYIRTVKNTDTQGIWGILQSGLTDNFARGMAIKRGEDVNTYKVDIPHSADEMLNNHASSFLGRLIYEKSQRTSIYNLQLGRISKDPDLIYPGQELLIIRFTPEELISIYKHFVNAGKA